MQKGLIARQGIIIGMIEKVYDGDLPYRFTYDPYFEECYQLGDMKIRDEPYYLERLPYMMYSHLKKISGFKLERLRNQPGVIDDLDLWLLCCEEGLIPEEDGCRI